MLYPLPNRLEGKPNGERDREQLLLWSILSDHDRP